MTMFKPPHPCLVIREDVLLELGLTVTAAASQLGVSRVTLSRVINGRAAVSADMAFDLIETVPESASMTLLALGMVGLFAVRRRYHD